MTDDERERAVRDIGEAICTRLLTRGLSRADQLAVLGEVCGAVEGFLLRRGTAVERVEARMIVDHEISRARATCDAVADQERLSS